VKAATIIFAELTLAVAIVFIVLRTTNDPV
jgi:hypothetical protein